MHLITWFSVHFHPASTYICIAYSLCQSLWHSWAHSVPCYSWCRTPNGAVPDTPSPNPPRPQCRCGRLKYGWKHTHFYLRMVHVAKHIFHLYLFRSKHQIIQHKCCDKMWECFTLEYLTFFLSFVWPWNWQEFKVWDSSHAKSLRSSESSDHLWSYPPHQFFLSANVKRARQSNYVPCALWGSFLSLVQPRPSVEV